MKYGLFDTKDRLWLGNKLGPFSYPTMREARAAATIANWRLEERLRVRPGPLPKKFRRVVDEIVPPLTLKQALRKHGIKP